MNKFMVEVACAILAVVFLATIIFRRRKDGGNNQLDLVEWSLLVAFVTIAAAAILPNVAESIRVVFDKINAALAAAPH